MAIKNMDQADYTGTSGAAKLRTALTSAGLWQMDERIIYLINNELIQYNIIANTPKLACVDRVIEPPLTGATSKSIRRSVIEPKATDFDWLTQNLSVAIDFKHPNAPIIDMYHPQISAMREKAELVVVAEYRIFDDMDMHNDKRHKSDTVYYSMYQKNEVIEMNKKVLMVDFFDMMRTWQENS